MATTSKAKTYISWLTICFMMVAAVANKLARTIWAVLIKGQPWNPNAWQGQRMTGL